MAIVMLNVKILFPTEISFEDSKAFGEYISTLPRLAFVVVWLAHLGQTAVGGYAAAILTKRAMPVYIVAVLTMIGTVVNQLNLPAPLWTWFEILLHPIVSIFIVHCTIPQKRDTKKG
eukprot:CAMPEP_0202502346 /NCGR_PEP_ID=MMETSP1361-20130828/38716_1 /ASSEMBLY_ACC=CAM_ASM_000849 /TAXON_ID=210615 /ORGANISM="Staurosira complex sp., Strain CCMP2646" /LENGTH=116 /DNA_ID=CAMNT_0049135343 /DNA_START=88 /DNA_END=438 /DNA_ORIENTATION=-